MVFVNIMMLVFCVFFLVLYLFNLPVSWLFGLFYNDYVLDFGYELITVVTFFEKMIEAVRYSKIIIDLTWNGDSTHIWSILF